MFSQKQRRYNVFKDWISKNNKSVVFIRHFNVLRGMSEYITEVSK